MARKHSLCAGDGLAGLRRLRRLGHEATSRSIRQSHGENADAGVLPLSVRNYVDECAQGSTQRWRYRTRFCRSGVRYEDPNTACLAVVISARCAGLR